MIIIGIDPSMKNTGFAVLEYEGTSIKVLETATYNMETVKGDRGFQGFRNRLRNYFEMCMGESVPKFCYESNPFGAAHGRTKEQGDAIRRGQMRSIGFIQGCMRMAGIEELGGINGNTAKAALCHGHATKDEMIRAVRIRFALNVDEHSADAVAVAMAGVKQVYAEEMAKQQKTLKVAKGKKVAK